jgi:hypothetical protein
MRTSIRLLCSSESLDIQQLIRELGGSSTYRAEVPLVYEAEIPGRILGEF